MVLIVVLKFRLQSVWLLYICHHRASPSLSADPFFFIPFFFLPFFFSPPFLNHPFLHHNTTILICLLISLSFNYLQEPSGICRPMNRWRWWSSTMACRPWPTRSSSPTQGGSTSQMRTQSLVTPNGPPSSRTPPAASGRASQKLNQADVH